MITMSVAPGSLRAGDVLPATSADLPAEAPSFDDVYRRQVDDRAHDDVRPDRRDDRAHDRRSPLAAERSQSDRRIVDDRAARPSSSGSVDARGADALDHTERSGADARTDREDGSDDVDATQAADPRGANAATTDGGTQSAAAPSGQAPASSPEATASSAPGLPPVAVIPIAATGHALLTPAAGANPTGIETPATLPSDTALGDTTLGAALDAAPGVTVRSITVEQVATVAATAETAPTTATAAATSTTGGPIRPLGAVPALPDTHPSATAGAAATTAATTTDDAASAAAAPVVAAGAAPPDADVPAVAPTPATPSATTAAPTPAGPPTAAAAVTAAAAATAAADPAATPNSSESRPAGAPAVEARLDPAVAGSTKAGGPVPTAAAGPGVATTDAAATLPSPLHDAVTQAQRDLQIRRAEQVTRIGIDLATEGLGAIHVEASTAGGGLHLQLGADRATTRQLLAEHAASLRDEIGAGGTSVSVDIGRGDVGRGDAGRSDHRPVETVDHRGPATPRHVTPASVPASPTASRTLVSGDGGVDVRI